MFCRSETKFDSGSGMFTLIMLFWMLFFSYIIVWKIIHYIKSHFDFKWLSNLSSDMSPTSKQGSGMLPIIIWDHVRIFHGFKIGIKCSVSADFPFRNRSGCSTCLLLTTEYYFANIQNILNIWRVSTNDLGGVHNRDGNLSVTGFFCVLLGGTDSKLESP